MRETLAAYDRHLRLQAELSFGLELSFFHGRRAWEQAETVLDLGCGNGEYTRRLATAFPQKRFVAVDLRADAIEVAVDRNGCPNVDYRCGTVAVAPERVDVLFSRFCLLYVSDFREILDWVASHVELAILQVDDDAELQIFPPILDPWAEVLHVVRRRRRDGGARSARTVTAPQWASIGFRAAWSSTVAVCSEPPFDRARLAELLVATAELSVGSPLPEPVAASLRAWEASDAYAQYGIRASCFERI